MATRTSMVVGGEIPWVDLGNGLKRKVLAYDEKMMLTSVSFKKGAVGSLHSHPHTQVTYIQQGSFEVTIGSEKKTLRAGDSFLAPSGIQHGVVALEDGILVDVFTPMREDFVRPRSG